MHLVVHSAQKKKILILRNHASAEFFFVTFLIILLSITCVPFEVNESVTYNRIFYLKNVLPTEY